VSHDAKALSLSSEFDELWKADSVLAGGFIIGSDSAIIQFECRSLANAKSYVTRLPGKFEIG